MFAQALFLACLTAALGSNVGSACPGGICQGESEDVTSLLQRSSSVATGSDEEKKQSGQRLVSTSDPDGEEQGQCIQIVAHVCTAGYKDGYEGKTMTAYAYSNMMTLVKNSRKEKGNLVYDFQNEGTGIKTLEIFSGPVQEKETPHGPAIFSDSTSLHDTTTFAAFLKFRNNACEAAPYAVKTSVPCPPKKKYPENPCIQIVAHVCTNGYKEDYKGGKTNGYEHMMMLVKNSRKEEGNLVYDFKDEGPGIETLEIFKGPVQEKDMGGWTNIFSDSTVEHDATTFAEFLKFRNANCKPGPRAVKTVVECPPKKQY